MSEPGGEEVGTEPSGWWHAILHPSRRGRMLLLAGATTFALLGVAFLLPVPYIKLSPGPTFNVIGEADGEPVISISGTQTYPTSGSLDMTTVLELGGPRGGLTFVDAVASWFNASNAVVPSELLYPEDMTGEEVKQRQAIMFSTSESDAIAAAMNYLQVPVDTATIVTTVYGDSPADGVLLPRDEIVQVDDVQITAPDQVAKQIRAQPIGTEFAITVNRDGTEQVVHVTSAPNPDDATVPYIGIGVDVLAKPDFDISFTLNDVGGPSAGLMFATGIVDKLTPGDLTGGNHVAGTGTIAADGTVGPIGGIRQKLAGARNAGATLFVMPKAHCAEAADHIPDGLTVVPVETLTDAVTAIEAYAAEKPVASCPAPDATAAATS